jgi:REP element-mobilizing transposase RayT
MAQSLSNVILHLVFSTKNRQAWIDVEIEAELHKYFAGICRDIKCPSHKIGGADDHIHIACSLSFQDEYRQILAKYEIEYDERYVWDCLARATAIPPFQGLCM